MSAMNKIKQFALAYVPGMETLRDLRNKIRYVNELEARLSRLCAPGMETLRDLRNKIRYANGLEARLFRLEESLLPALTAQLLNKLAPYQSPSTPLIRVGNKYDGGYIMGDIFGQVDAAYSFGIAHDVTWDKDIAERSIPVFMYDHTIDGLPEEHENFHFFKIGICGKPNIKGMKDISTLIHENGHQGKTLLMKMDIEGSEYPAIQALTEEEVSQFTQIALEIHDLQNLLFDAEKHFMISQCLEKILQHMHCVHIHANNFGWVAERNGISVPVVLELSFIRKDMAVDFQRTDKLRTDLDAPNNPKIQEIDVHNLWKQI